MEGRLQDQARNMLLARRKVVVGDSMCLRHGAGEGGVLV